MIRGFSMANLTSYTCIKCGGVLNVDSDQEVLDCPFCGTQIDFVVFHRKDILSQAELCLKRMEFKSAYERYRELYDKYPKDFEALRGLMLCAGNIPVKEDLVTPKKLIRHDLDRAIDYLGKHTEDCSGYPYFTNLEAVFKLCLEYRVYVLDKEDVEKTTKQQLENLTDNGSYNVDHALRGIASYNRKNMDSLSEIIKELERKLRLACARVKMSEPRPDEPVVYSSPVNKAKLDPDTESISNISCIKCGGQLVMDKKRSLCECRSCGVAYGTSLFFGEPNKKAKDALVKQEFAEADQRYSYMLMLDPHNFDALRGRVLCAAKWSSIRVEPNISSFWVKNLRSRIEYALGNASDEDKPYFKKCIEMMDAYDDVLLEDNKLKPLVRKHKELDYKREHIVVDFDPDYDRNKVIENYAEKAVDKSIEDLEKQMSRIRNRRAQCLDEVTYVCVQIREMDKKRITDKDKEN